MDELEAHIVEAIEKFRGKIDSDDSLRNELKGLVRAVNIDTTDNEGFSFMLDDAEVRDFTRGKLEDADITISATTKDLTMLFTGQLKPMRAWATKRLKVKASLDDIMRIRKFL